MSNFFAKFLEKGILCVAILLGSLSINAIAVDQASPLREIRKAIQDLKHELSNHEAELRTFQEKLNNQDNTVEALRQQTHDAHLAQKESLKGNATTLEAKILSLETSTKSLIADIKQLKEHANESASALSQCTQRLSKFEKVLDVQNQNMVNLETALRTLMQVSELKETTNSSKIYKVKSGDSLGEIAKNHQTTIRAIKELNHLTADKITVGQTLKIP